MQFFNSPILKERTLLINNQLGPQLVQFVASYPRLHIAYSMIATDQAVANLQLTITGNNLLGVGSIQTFANYFVQPLATRLALPLILLSAVSNGNTCLLLIQINGITPAPFNTITMTSYSPVTQAVIQPEILTPVSLPQGIYNPTYDLNIPINAYSLGAQQSFILNGQYFIIN